MPRTKNHVYFAVYEGVIIVSIWGSAASPWPEALIVSGPVRRRDRPRSIWGLEELRRRRSGVTWGAERYDPRMLSGVTSPPSLTTPSTSELNLTSVGKPHRGFQR